MTLPGGRQEGAGVSDPRLLSVDRGRLHPQHLVGRPQETFGIMVRDGLIIARHRLGRAHAAWLIGPGDLIRPWEMAQISLIRGTQWQVLSPATLVRLDGDLGERIGADPRLARNLVSALARTNHWLFAKGLVISCPSVEERLLMLFALWGERWGKVTRDGVRIDLPLTHANIAELCGTRRPTVSIALRSLELRGTLARRSPSEWLLRRGSEQNGHPRAWSQCVAGLGAALADGGGGGVPA